LILVRNLIFILMIISNRGYSADLLNYNQNFNLNKSFFNLKTSGTNFDFTEPLYLSCIGGGSMIIILFIIYCIFRKRGKDVPKQESSNNEAQRIITESNQQKNNDKGKDIINNQNNADKSVNDVTKDLTNRQLVTPLEKKKSKNNGFT